MNQTISFAFYAFLSLGLPTAASAQSPDLPYDPATPVYQGQIRIPGSITVRANQVVFDANGPKMVVIQSDVPLPDTTTFELKTGSGIVIKGGSLRGP